MSEHPEEPSEHEEDPIELTEPEIEEEIADSDEWMQKGLTDSDPPEEESAPRPNGEDR